MMIPFVIGVIVGFSFWYRRGTFSNRKGKKRIPTPVPKAPIDLQPEEFIPKSQMVDSTVRREDPKPEPKKREDPPKIQKEVVERKRGSFDDILPGDAGGDGVDEYQELDTMSGAEDTEDEGA